MYFYKYIGISLSFTKSGSDAGMDIMIYLEKLILTYIIKQIIIYAVSCISYGLIVKSKGHCQGRHCRFADFQFQMLLMTFFTDFQ